MLSTNRSVPSLMECRHRRVQLAEIVRSSPEPPKEPLLRALQLPPRRVAPPKDPYLQRAYAFPYRLVVAPEVPRDLSDDVLFLETAIDMRPGLDGDITIYELVGSVPESITFEILNTSCGLGDTFAFFLNGTSLGTTAADPTNGCTCTPPIQTFAVTDSGLIASLWNPGGNNTFRFVKTGGNNAFAWVRARLEAGASSEDVCVFDFNGGNCSATNLCFASFTFAGVDQSTTITDAFVTRVPVSITPFVNSELPATIDISTLPDGPYVLCVASGAAEDCRAFTKQGEQAVGINGPCNQPPEIDCNGAIELWPPQHDLIDVSSAFTVTDPDGDPVTCTFRVYSNEREPPGSGDGLGRFAPDFKTTLASGAEGVFLRSERSGRAQGRHYTVVITADDGNGGVTTKLCTLAYIPHDQSDSASIDLILDIAAANEAIIQAAVAGDNLPDPPADPTDPLPAPLLGLFEHGLSQEFGPKQ